MTTLTSFDHGRTIEVPVGESIAIRLPENPTTGYRWTVDSITPRILTADEGRFAPEVDVGVGGGGYREIQVRVTHEGAAEIRLKLGQPWEGENAVADRFEVRFVVRG
jgi:inhibitor of cysteine peptidase